LCSQEKEVSLVKKKKKSLCVYLLIDLERGEERTSSMQYMSLLCQGLLLTSILMKLIEVVVEENIMISSHA
jgi:hypothetical protein